MSSRTSPGWACLVLVVCLLAVGSHFFGESLTAARADPPTARTGPGLHPGHDLAGDQFVLSASVGLFGESGRLWGPPPLLLTGGLASFTPPTPPPDL
ncbi:MAG: hypothetical protein FJZ97_10490 [Chloroflexi bacterium]|nr:hypothetical protein [Chloroflexota bacterium]